MRRLDCTRYPVDQTSQFNLLPGHLYGTAYLLKMPPSHETPKTTCELAKLESW